MVAAIDSDRLYPVRQLAEMAGLAPGCQEYQVIESPYGHDGFLIEIDAVAALTGTTLALAQAATLPS